MIIDAISFLLLLMAIFKGWRKGFVVALFSFLAFVVGLIAALKLSAATAKWLEGTVNVSAKWLPVLAFLLVFIVVIVVVNLLAKILEQTVEWAMLGWLNKAAGILLYMMFYVFTWSIILFYLGKTNLLSAKTIGQSHSYPIIAPWGPRIVETVADWIPAFRNMFEELSRFFGLF